MEKRIKLRSFIKKSLVVMTIFILGLMMTDTPQAGAVTTYPYLIKVNRKMCTVTIYEKNSKGEYTIPVKAMICSPGWDTPLGTFRTPEKYRWKLLMDNVWGQYSTRINKGVLFHSVWYYQKDPSTLSNVQYNKLGTVCSHGCVRLTVEDAKWIYDNCPVGTTVTIYDSNNPGPLGKPTAAKVSTSSVMGYDPTDIWSPGNPYIKKSPQISGVKNATIKYGKKVDLLSKVKAHSSTGEDITSKLKVSVKFEGKKVKAIDTTKAGKYYVTYSVTDILKKKTEKEVIYTVEDDTRPVIIGAKNRYINDEDVDIDYDFAVETVWAEWHGKELEPDCLDVKINKSKKKNKTYTEYEVIYTATAPNGRTAKKTKLFFVDLEAPAIDGVTDKEITWDTEVDEAFIMEGVSVSDNVTVAAARLKYSVKMINDTTYKVVYAATDRAGNKSTAEAIYTIMDFLRFEGIGDRTITANTNLTEAEALKDIKAYNGSVEITSSIKVTISEPIDNQYTVTYEIMDDDGHTQTATAIFTMK